MYIKNCKYHYENFSADPCDGVDLRPRVAMIIGDGFSAGLRTHLKATHINVNQLFPPVGTPRHRTAIGEPLIETEHEGLGAFPELEAAWKAYVVSCTGGSLPSLHGFCSDFADYVPFEAGPAFGGKMFAMDFKGMQYQLRLYLWRLFRWHHDQVWHPGADEALKGWAWLEPLRFLALRTRLTVISYNYDCNLEAVLAKLGLNCHRPIEKCVEAYTNRPGRRPVVLKPHGCLFRRTLEMLGNGINDVVWINSTGFSRSVGPELRVCPKMPDLVPPGQDLRQHANPTTDVLDAAHLAMSEADLVAVFGFSARVPDNREFSSLALQLRPAIPVVHIGLESDRDTPAADILREGTSNYHFCNGRYASNIAAIPRRVTELTQWAIPTNVELPPQFPIG